MQLGSSLPTSPFLFLSSGFDAQRHLLGTQKLVVKAVPNIMKEGMLRVFNFATMKVILNFDGQTI